MSSDIKKFEKSLNEIKKETHSLEKRQVGNPEMPSGYRFLLTLGIISFIYFLGQSIFSLFFPIYDALTNSLMMLDSSVFFMPIYTVSAMILTLLIYYNVFMFFIWEMATLGPSKAMEDFNNSIAYKQLWIILILLVPIGIDSLALNSNTDSDDVLYFGEEKVDETSNSFMDTIEEFQCRLFNPQCILEKEQQDEDTQAETTSYSIDIEDPISTYTKSRLERPIPINLEIQSKGGNLYLNKLECFRGDFRDNNLIHTQNLNNREIENIDSRNVGGLSCDLSNLEVEKGDEIEITTVVYYTLQLDYTQEIPIINYNKYIQNQEKDYLPRGEIKSQFEVKQPVNTAKSALKITRFLNPQPPLIINHPDFTNENYFMDLTLEKSSYQLGELNSTRLENFDYPSDIIQFSEFEKNILFDAYDDEIPISLEFSISEFNDNSNFIEVPIKMTFNNTMKYEESFFFRIANK